MQRSFKAAIIAPVDEHAAAHQFPMFVMDSRECRLGVCRDQYLPTVAAGPRPLCKPEFSTGAILRLREIIFGQVAFAISCLPPAKTAGSARRFDSP